MLANVHEGETVPTLIIIRDAFAFRVAHQNVQYSFFRMHIRLHCL